MWLKLWSFWCADKALLCWLNFWSLGSRFTEDGNTCTLHYALFTLITHCVSSLILHVLDHCMYCTGCATDSLNQCQWKVLRIFALYPHHCAFHGTVKHSAYLAQVTVKNPDRVHTGLARIAHCKLCWRKILNLCSLFVCLFVLFCFVLFCFVSFRFVLFCLFCFVLFCFVCW